MKPRQPKRGASSMRTAGSVTAPAELPATVPSGDLELYFVRSEGTLTGTVTHLIFKGVHYEMEVTANGFEWLVHSTDMFPVGTEVGIRVDPFDIQIMNKPASEDEEAVSIDE